LTRPGLCYVAPTNLEGRGAVGKASIRAEVGLAADARILIVARDDVRAGPLAEGEEVGAVIINLEPEKQKLGLSIKQLKLS